MQAMADGNFEMSSYFDEQVLTTLRLSVKPGRQEVVLGARSGHASRNVTSAILFSAKDCLIN